MIKNFFIFVFVLGLCAINSGCVKLNTYVHERVDLDVKGNQGYLTGNPPLASTVTKEDRKVLQLEITLPEPKHKMGASPEDNTGDTATSSQPASLKKESAPVKIK